MFSFLRKLDQFFNHNIQIKKMENAVTFTVVIREEQLIVKQISFCAIFNACVFPFVADNTYACDFRIKKFKDEEKEKKLAEKRAKEEAARAAAEEKERVSESFTSFFSVLALFGSFCSEVLIGSL